MRENDIIDKKCDTAKRYCRALYDIMTAKGVKDIVLSPGSRNAPLLIGAKCRKELNERIILDERTAAFIALGIAMQTQRPVAIACTSGTALYNYAPAVAEAMYQSIPLIVITADRPKEWIDQDDSQTLRQFEALEKIVKKSYDIPVERKEVSDTDWYVNRIVNEAMNLACSGKKGPVHINIQFDNPLAETVPYKESFPRIVSLLDEYDFSQIQYDRIADKIRKKKVLVTAGFMQPDYLLNKALIQLGRFANIKILCETISNLHLPGDSYAIDTILAPLECSEDESIRESLYPDLVISIGGSLVSRKLKEFIRRAPSCSTWTLSDTDVSVDCFKNLSAHFEITPVKFFTGLVKAMKRLERRDRNGLKPNNGNSYFKCWEDVRLKAKIKQVSFLKNCIWSEIKAFEYIFSHLPQQSNIFLSNGTVVRYAQLFTTKQHHASFGNRGVSGIEGTSATALGCALDYNGTTVLITGDMSFAYNPEILALGDICRRFKIILINNNGGAIFRFIPSTRTAPDREELFCTRPPLAVQEMCASLGWSYYCVDNETQNRSQFHKFIGDPGNSLIEYRFDGESSPDQLLEYMKLKI